MARAEVATGWGGGGSDGFSFHKCGNYLDVTENCFIFATDMLRRGAGKRRPADLDDAAAANVKRKHRRKTVIGRVWL